MITINDLYGDFIEAKNVANRDAARAKESTDRCRAAEARLCKALGGRYADVKLLVGGKPRTCIIYECNSWIHEMDTVPGTENAEVQQDQSPTAGATP